MVNVFGSILLSSTPISPLLGLSTFGLGSWAVGILEPAVAAYALRLYRNLGARVGLWLVTTFCLLALGHLFQPCGATAKIYAGGVSLDFLALIVPLLLLIGMAHTESIFVDRVRVEQKEQKLRLERESEAQEKIAVLLKEKASLREWLANCEERAAALEQSAQQYSLLFTENPQPMWVFDQCSLRVLAVNNAALVQSGFTTQEFLAKNVRDFFSAEEAKTFLANAAEPAPHRPSREVWHQRRKDGTPFEVELTIVHLKYSHCSASLVLAREITGPQAAAPVS